MFSLALSLPGNYFYLNTSSSRRFKVGLLTGKAIHAADNSNMNLYRFQIRNEPSVTMSGGSCQRIIDPYFLLIASNTRLRCSQRRWTEPGHSDICGIVDRSSVSSTSCTPEREIGVIGGSIDFPRTRKFPEPRPRLTGSGACWSSPELIFMMVYVTELPARWHIMVYQDE